MRQKKNWGHHSRHIHEYCILIYAADRVGDRWKGQYMFPSDLPLTMDSIGAIPPKAMPPTLFVYGTMPARAWVMVWVKHPNEKSVQLALVPRYKAL